MICQPALWYVGNIRQFYENMTMKWTYIYNKNMSYNYQIDCPWRG